MSSPTIAIVGSGPAGCYLAQALRKQWPESEIIIIDKLPVPYGLIRYGVAPDHIGTKAVTKQFERLFERDNISFLGNLEIGKDLSLAELKAAYDIVVIAIGLYGDKKLAISGDQLAHIYGSGQLTRFWNDHPDEIGFTPLLGENVVIVGNGNVAIDILRLLTKTAAEFDGSELSPASLAHLQEQPVKTISIVGRSPATLAKFDTVMIRELAKLQDVIFKIDQQSLLEASIDNEDKTKLTALVELTEKIPITYSKEVIFYFGWQPAQILGSDKVEAITFIAINDATKKITLPADSIITAIGFEEQREHALSHKNLICSQSILAEGRLSEGLYCVGWFKRGPKGTIPENRQDAKQVAETITQDIMANNLSTGKKGFTAIVEKLPKTFIDYKRWKKIDIAEQNQAIAQRHRQKFRHKSDMLNQI